MTATASAPTSSACAAIFFALAITLSAAMVTAVPPIAAEREPIVPMPKAT